MADVLIMECPTCGRLWVDHPYKFNFQRVRESPHAPALFHGNTYLERNAGQRTCYGIPESVTRKDAEAAWTLGGQEAAELCVNRSLRDAIEDYERRQTVTG